MTTPTPQPAPYRGETPHLSTVNATPFAGVQPAPTYRTTVGEGHNLDLERVAQDGLCVCTRCYGGEIELNESCAGRLERQRDEARARAKELSKELKELKLAITIEGMDPCGTIWDHADKVQKENADLRAQLTAARERIDNLEASHIHSCHDQCQRPMCVLRRERDALVMQLAARERTGEGR